jgi:hypothetical protein
MIPTLVAVVVAVILIAPSLKGVDLDRMAGVLSPGDVLWRLYIVVGPAFDVLLETPLGRGLGYGTHGVPVFLNYLIARYNPFMIDGDFGHAAVDFGIVGTVAYCIMMVRGVSDSVSWTNKLRGTDAESIGITSSALFSLCLVNFVTGSPFLHVPGGSIVWYLIGGLNRIIDERQKKNGQIDRMGRMGLAPLPAVRPPILSSKRPNEKRLSSPAGVASISKNKNTGGHKSKPFLYE